MLKYTKEGEEVVVISETTDGRYVVAVDYGEDLGPEFVVDKLFDEVPTARQNETIARLEAQIEKAREDYLHWVDKINEAKKEWDLVCKHKPTKHLLDYIQGKITHYVKLGLFTPEIVEFNSQRDHYKNLKLLSLSGDSNGNLEYKIHEYSDGSGYGSTVIPCTSYEEAVEKLREYLKKEVSKPGFEIGYWSIHDTLRKYDVEVDPSLFRAFYERQLKDKKGSIERKVKELDDQRSGVAEIEKLLKELNNA